MKIHIQNFRQIKEKVFEIHRGQLTLLKGNSGAGKTTMLEAIRWCLYEGMRNIYPNGDKKLVVSVMIEVDDISIYREAGKKKRFVVNYSDGKQYEGTVAQALIDRLYGKKDVWLACCYICQKSMCSLLTASQNDKIDILNNISFCNEDPHRHIEKLQQKAKEIGDKHMIQDEILIRAKKEYAALSNESKFIPENYMTDLDFAHLLGEEKRLLGDKEDLTSRLLKQRQTEGQIKALQSQKAELSDKVCSLADYEDHVLAGMETNYETITSIEKMKAEIANFAKSVQSIGISDLSKGSIRDEIEKIDLSYKQEDYAKTVQKEGQIQNMLQVTGKNKIAYNQDAIEAAKNNASLLLKRHEKFSQYQQNKKKIEDWKLRKRERERTFNEMQESRKRQVSEALCDYEIAIAEQEKEAASLQTFQRDLTVTSSLPTSSQEEIAEQLSYIQKLKNGSCSLKCPHCKCGVRFTNNRLEAGQGICKKEKEKYGQDLKEAQEKLQILKANNQRIQDIQLLKKYCEDSARRLEQLGVNTQKALKNYEILRDRPVEAFSFDEPCPVEEANLEEVSFPIPEDRWPIIKKSIDELLSISYIEPPTVKSDDILRLLNRKKDLENILPEIGRMEEIKTQLREKENSLSMKVTLKEIQDYRLNLNIKKQSIEELMTISGKIAEMRETIDAGIEDRLLATTNILEEKQAKIALTKVARTLHDSHQNVEREKDKLNVLSEEMKNARNLTNIAIKLESEFLEETLERINQALSEMLPLIFDDPITVKLSLYKEIKSNKKTAIKFNMVIHYKGNIYDNINQLSGGEKDRVSLSIILALNRVNNSPFLFLDECVGSLDSGLKERCVSVIGNNVASNKAVVSVTHDCVEGYYDNVITPY